MGVHQTKTFMSGNSVAVRLPRDLGFAADQRVTIERNGDEVTIRPVDGREEAKRRLKALCDDLRAMGPMPGGVQERDPFEFPDRPGL